MTGFGKTGLVAGYVKIDFILEKASTKFKYCLRKISLYIAYFHAMTLNSWPFAIIVFFNV